MNRTLMTYGYSAYVVWYPTVVKWGTDRVDADVNVKKS